MNEDIEIKIWEKWESPITREGIVIEDPHGNGFMIDMNEFKKLAGILA
jgi:hypothetical protein